jgi:hypothetical protein
VEARGDRRGEVVDCVAQHRSANTNSSGDAGVAAVLGQVDEVWHGASEREALVLLGEVVGHGEVHEVSLDCDQAGAELGVDLLGRLWIELEQSGSGLLLGLSQQCVRDRPDAGSPFRFSEPEARVRGGGESKRRFPEAMMRC